MQYQIIQQVRVRQQGHINSKNCGERPWESIGDKKQAMIDVRQEGLTRTSIDTPHQRTCMGSITLGSPASRGKGLHRDKDQVIMIKCTMTGKKERKVHLYEQTMIGRTSPQQGKLNKRRNNRNRCKQEEHNCRGYHRYKGRERRNPCVDRNRPRIQQRSCHRLDRMVRMKRTHNKRNPLGKETTNCLWRVSRMEQATKDTKGTFHTLVAPKGKAIITQWEKEIKAKRKGKN
jgi:hypothetical protein